MSDNINEFLTIFRRFRHLINKTQNAQTCMHLTMLRLSFAYAIFTAPLLPAHLVDNTSYNRLRMTPFRVGFVNTICIQILISAQVTSVNSSFSFQSMILFSWYCWMYAINVIIYVVSSSEFRKVYRIFFEDVFAGFAALWRRGCFFRASDSSPAIELSSHVQ